MMDWSDLKQRIRDSVKIPYLLESWYGVTLNGAGRGRCPLCDYEKDKRVFCVSPDEKGFCCHHCKVKGDIFVLVMRKENVDFMEALTKLANHAGIEIELTHEQEKKYNQERERAAAIYQFAKYFYERLTVEVKAYLKKRKIESEYIKTHCIGFIPEKATYQGNKQDIHHLQKMGLMYNQKDVTHKWCNRLFIPFWKNGHIVYFAGRSIDEKVEPLQLLPNREKMGNKPVVGDYMGDSVFIVEGVFDFLTAHQEPGLKSVMAILGNSSVFDLPGYIKTVELCFDWDKTGYDYIDKHGLHFASKGKTVKLVTRPMDLPQGKNDLNDYIQADGKIENLEKIDLTEWYLNHLKTTPFEDTIKKKFFKSIATMGMIEQEKYINRLYEEILKAQGVGKKTIKRDFVEFQKVEKSNELYSFTDKVSGNDFKLPYNYAFKDNKLILISTGEVIAEKKIYISRLLDDTTEKETYCEIVSFYNNKTITSIEPNLILSNRKDIVLLSKKNFPVTSENAGKLIQFLDKFKYKNEEKLKPQSASSQLGWQGDNFIFPDRVINGKGEIVPGHFIGGDPPRDTFTSKGNLNTYVEFIRDIKTDLAGARWVIPVFVIYATLASFILELLNEKPIILHFTETTGRGKTSIMKLAASAYGKADYNNNWNDTTTALQRKAVKLKNFPLLINEGSIVEQKKGLAGFLYTLAEGQSRTKATMDSTNETTPIKLFFSVIISNGETSLLTGNESGGVLMRVNEFYKTLGGINHNFIERLERTINNNYGLLIEPFLKKVIELRKGKSCVKINRKGQNIEIKSLDAFPKFENYDKTDRPNSGNINRKIKSFQPVYIAGCIAEYLFNFGYDPVDVVGCVFDESCIYIIENLNRAKRVMDALGGFYQEHRSKFFDLESLSKSVDELLKEAANTNKTFFGYRKEQDLMIFPNVFTNIFLKDFNDSCGKSAAIIKRELKEEGFIKVDKNKLQKTVRIGGDTVKVIFFPDFFNTPGNGSE